ncbi:MAG TPA: hypothetical protein VD994_18610 [Prosthecobacter sp.]|nr:hypothetical protein [Prosthecobacter sp.]
MTARVAEIYIAPAAGAAMCRLTSVEAIPGKGLAGDRYAQGGGTYAHYPGNRDVTFFAMEALLDVEIATGIVLHPSQTRRSVITEGVKLSSLINVEFSIGPVRFLGLRPCPPCLYLAGLLKMPEVLKGLAHGGGIYAQILEGGTFRVNDLILREAAEKAAEEQAPAATPWP